MQDFVCHIVYIYGKKKKSGFNEHATLNYAQIDRQFQGGERKYTDWSNHYAYSRNRRMDPKVSYFTWDRITTTAV